MGKGKRILIVTSGQPSTNPRMVKEADLLAEKGYEVEVLYQHWADWAGPYDKELLRKKKWKATRVGGSPQSQKISYYITRLQHKISKEIYKISKGKWCSEAAQVRSFFPLLKAAKSKKAHFFIGHNLGALPIVVRAAKKWNVPCAFDAEDFHRGELDLPVNHHDIILRRQVEEKYFNKVSYLTTASPLTSFLYKELFPGLKIETVLNVFSRPEKSFTRKKENGRALRLFWFSQTIGFDRGLEDIISAVDKLESLDIELHLLGQVRSDVKEAFINLSVIKGATFISYYNPIDSTQIPTFASKFDVGIASELNYPANKDVCLSNKIFTYMQAGLAIIASSTKAQKDLLNSNPGLGFNYESKNIGQLQEIFLQYYNDRDLLFHHQKTSYSLAESKFNWEMESEKVLALVDSTIR